MKMRTLATVFAGACLTSVAVANHTSGHHSTAMTTTPSAPVPVPPVVDASKALVQGNSVWPNRMLPVWGERVFVGGMASMDGYWSNEVNYTTVPMFNQAASNALGAGGNASALYINNANLFVGGQMGIAEAHLNVGYFDRRTVTNATTGTLGAANNFTLDEGYVTLSDFSHLPLYMKIGKFYNQFGDYNPYQIVPDLTNLFSVVDGTGIEAGVVLNNGFYASATGFSATSSAFSTTNQSRVGDASAKAGYVAKNGDVDWGVDVSYLNAIKDLAYVNSNDFLVNYGLATGSAVANFNKNSGLWAGYAHMKISRLDANLKYVQANDDMLINGSNTLDEPWALAAGAGYNFDTAGRASRLGLGYQMTRHADWLYVPRSRYLATYGIAINTYLGVQLAYYYDKNYSNNAIAAVDHNNLLAARLSVAF